MAITINVVDFTPRFKGDGYAMSYVTQKVLHSRIAKLDAGDGRVGFGEIISDPGQATVDICRGFSTWGYSPVFERT